ncbi:MAG: hypothetical protein Q8M17_04965 [Actinomycetota bacterium]|nr:hypothetical protein [Actinomycetota bacterium]
MSHTAEMVKVLAQREDGQCETFWASPVSGGYYAAENICVTVAIAKGDILRVENGEVTGVHIRTVGLHAVLSFRWGHNVPLKLQDRFNDLLDGAISSSGLFSEGGFATKALLFDLADDYHDAFHDLVDTARAGCTDDEQDALAGNTVELSVLACPCSPLDLTPRHCETHSSYQITL